ncbi:lingerer [Carabus blaptoides fortunei]
MSSSNRTTSKGGKGTKGDTTTKTQKSEKSDTQKIEKNKLGKGSGDKSQSQQNSDSIRNAKYKDLRPEDPSMKEKVCTVIEMTERSEEEACFALHECSFDINQAVNMLIESSGQEWVTSVKKKKNRQAASTNKTEGNTEAGADEWQDTPPAQTGNERDKSRTRGGGPPRMRGRGGWRGRENRENEKNLESEGLRRGGRMSNGPVRGGGSGRGGRGGGRLGSRTFQSREGGGPRNTFTRTTMDTWNANTATQGGTFGEAENWDNEFPSPIDDWYNEEYTGSLADTKVFTPSSVLESGDAPPEQQIIAGEAANIATPLEVPSATQQLTQALELRNQQQQPPSGIMPGETGGQPQSVQQPLSTQQGHAPPMGGVGSLTAAQSQYLSQLTQQTSETVNAQQNQSSGYAASTQQYNSNPVSTYSSTSYTGVGNYGNIPEHNNVQQSLPTRTKTQRARVPPPSKIPASAVEMPGDLNSSVGYLDVQFGALDFIDGNTFDGVTDKFSTSNNTGMEGTTPVPTSNLDLSAVSQPTALDGYTSSPPKPSQPQSSISSALSQSQMLSNTDSIPQPSGEHMSSVSGNYSQSRNTTSGTVPPAVSASALDIGKTSDVGHTYSQPPANTYQSYQSQKSNNSVYQAQNYNANNYQSSTQVTSTSSYVTNQPTNSYSNSNSGTYNNPNAAAVNSYQNNSYTGSGSSYQTATPAFPSITQAGGSFPTTANNQSTYQQSSGQSVYGSGTGLSNSSNYNVTSSNQYNSYNTSSTSSHNHKISSGKEQSSYDSATTASSTATTTTSVSASPALGLTNSQTSSNSAGTKVTSSAAKSGVVTNIPPGVAPMMGTQYIMGQAGMPFYQQPMYSYEDLQLLQQRVPPHIGAYYDIGYQTPTTLPTAREGSIASGAYSMSDSRFTRSDNNASPVPSTLSQQTSTQSHQAQPMLSATLPPGYAYFYNAGMMPGSFQYGTPAIYPQMPAATNAHGSTNLSQYPKPSNYGSGYGSGYDALTQSQDYAKGGYVGGTQTQSKTGGVGANAVTTGSSAATDLSVMYGKSHAALGKVNSYEKQGFHSGTPPPFNLAGNQSAGIAPSGTYGPQMYIPTMPHQQHHNTTLMHQPLHQDSGNSSGQRSQSSSQAKTGAKQTYPNSYWNPA